MFQVQDRRCPWSDRPQGDLLQGCAALALKWSAEGRSTSGERGPRMLKVAPKLICVPYAQKPNLSQNTYRCTRSFLTAFTSFQRSRSFDVYRFYQKAGSPNKRPQCREKYQHQKQKTSASDFLRILSFWRRCTEQGNVFQNDNGKESIEIDAEQYIDNAWIQETLKPRTALPGLNIIVKSGNQ